MRRACIAEFKSGRNCAETSRVPCIDDIARRVMTTNTAAETIEVASLRPGMFVHLDGGWLSHPFASSPRRSRSHSCRHSACARVRWSPELSESEAPGQAPALAAREMPATPTPARAAAHLADQRPAARGVRSPVRGSRAGIPGGVRPGPSRRRAKPRARHRGWPARSPRRCSARATSASACSPRTRAARAPRNPVNVTVLSLLLGRRLRFSGPDMIDLGIGALLHHDIGKIDLPSHVHQLDDDARADDRRLYESHVAMGVARARGRMGLTNGRDADRRPAPRDRRWPRLPAPDRQQPDHGIGAGRRARQPYDKLCNPDRMSRALTPHEAMATLFAHDRQQFDPLVLDTFIKMMGVYPPGTVVQLTDDRARHRRKRQLAAAAEAARARLRPSRACRRSPAHRSRKPRRAWAFAGA